MKKIVLISIFIAMIVVIIVLINNNIASKEKEAEQHSKENVQNIEVVTEDTSYAEQEVTTDEQITTQETTESVKLEEQEKEKVTSSPIVNDGSKNYVVETDFEYWNKYLASTEAMPIIKTDNIEAILTDLLRGYNNCIFCTNDFNENFKGYFSQVGYIKITNLDIKNKTAIASLMSNGNNLKVKIKFEIVDNLINNLTLTVE